MTKTTLSRSVAIVIAAAVLVPLGGFASADASSAKGVYKNCTKLNHKYPHGVGKKHAHDHTTGTPVTTFKHSTKLYKTAMRHNKGLDRDKDGIACEKR